MGIERFQASKLRSYLACDAFTEGERPLHWLTVSLCFHRPMMMNLSQNFRLSSHLHFYVTSNSSARGDKSCFSYRYLSPVNSIICYQRWGWYVVVHEVRRRVQSHPETVQIHLVCVMFDGTDWWSQWMSAFSKIPFHYRQVRGSCIQVGEPHREDCGIMIQPAVHAFHSICFALFALFGLFPPLRPARISMCIVCNSCQWGWKSDHDHPISLHLCACEGTEEEKKNQSIPGNSGHTRG